MAITDVLKQLGLTLGAIGAQGGQSLANAMQAQGNLPAFQQSQENARQHQQLLQQLQLQQMITPFQQQELNMRNQEYANQLQWHEDAVQAQQQTKRDQEHQWVLGNVGEGNIEATTQDDPAAQAIGGGFYRPKARPQLNIPDELKDFFPAGQKTFDLTRENMPFAEKMFGILETARAKKANLNVLDQTIAQGHKDIDSHFDQYGGPDKDRLRQVFHNRLNIAQQEDAVKGTTSQAQKVLEDLVKPSYWEQNRDKNEARQQAQADRLAAQGQREDNQNFWQASKNIEDGAKAVDSKVEVYHTLKASLDQHNAVGDSQAAIQLIKFLAGGQASGVRITNAEIQSVFGSMDKWDQFQKQVNLWSGRSNTQGLISNTYRKQIEKLVGMIGQKFESKQKAYQDARDQITTPGARTPDFKKSYDTLHKTLNGIDNGPKAMSLQDILNQQ